MLVICRNAAAAIIKTTKPSAILAKLNNNASHKFVRAVNDRK